MKVQKNELIVIDKYLLSLKKEKYLERPNDYYNSLQSMYSMLIRKFTRENNLIIRSILSHLPSLSGSFNPFIPSIELKELLKRNDIPIELRKEISEILHDKFSSCASLNDLEKAQQILSSIKVYALIK